MRLEDYDTTKRYQAAVIKNMRMTPEESSEEVRELTLEIDDPAFDFAVGQNIGVLVPGPHELGHEYHFRLYTIATAPEPHQTEQSRIEICVKRSDYIDEYSGEKYPGIASNYLCDRSVGDEITITGPYGLPFEIPEEKDSNLLLIGMGTGIAPFRGLIKHIYQNVGHWKGKIRLFYGARTGMEMLYMNDRRDDFANYYDEQTFAAFKALSPRPHWAELPALDLALEERDQELKVLLDSPKTYVYVAGQERIQALLDKALSHIMGAKEKWERRKAELIAGRRWVELIY